MFISFSLAFIIGLASHCQGFHFHHNWQRYKTLPLTSSALTSGKHGPGFGRMNHFLWNMVVMSLLWWIVCLMLIHVDILVNCTHIQTLLFSLGLPVGYIILGQPKDGDCWYGHPKHPEISQSTFSEEFNHGRKQPKTCRNIGVYIFTSNKGKHPTKLASIWTDVENQALGILRTRFQIRNLVWYKHV